MPKTVLFVGGGIETVPAIERAKQLGLRVVVSDANASAPGIRVADDHLLASTYDVSATVEQSQKYHAAVRRIHGVLCVASDIPLTVATVAHALGLPGISIESARLASDKLAMKQKFFSDGVPVPWFRPVRSAAELHDIVLQWGILLVIKPVDSRGARGVLRVTRNIDLDWAFNFSRRESLTGRVMVEEFLAGPQISTESVVLDGVAHTPGLADRNYELLEKFAPHIIENGGDLPTQLPDDKQQLIRELIQKAADSMGVRSGVVKGDVVLCDGRPFLIELAARPSGGYLCTHEIPLSTGVDFVTAAIRLALGEEVRASDLVPRYQRHISQRYLFPQPGRVARISGVENAAKMPGVVFCQVRVKEGDVVGPVNSHPARAGLVMAMGDSRDDAINRAQTAIRAIQIETVPAECQEEVGANR
jgi:biotin carboxylase